MKRLHCVLKFSAFLTILGSFSSVFSQPTTGPSEIKLLTPIDKVFVPKGFDSNDTTEIIVSGFLPDLCYQKPVAQVYFEKNDILVFLTSTKIIKKNDFCLQVVDPFVETISVGRLDQGNYRLAINPGTPFESLTEVNVIEAEQNSIDDHLYANVEFIEPSLEKGEVFLKGQHPSSCFAIDEVKIISNGLDTYSILPIMKKLTDTPCPLKKMPFSHAVKVPTELKGDRILLHVRSIKGKSVNLVISANENGFGRAL